MKEKKPAAAKAMELLLYRNRSEAELRKKLLEKDYSEEETDEAVKYVASFGYLNDRRFAEQYVASRAGSKGRTALWRELKEKGISEEIISDALAEMPDDEEETALELIRKRAGVPHRMEEKEYRRLFGFLSRRGFAGSSIHKALHAYEEEAEED